MVGAHRAARRGDPWHNRKRRKEPTTLTTTEQEGRWPAEVAHLPVCPHRDLPVPYIAEESAGDCGEPGHPPGPHAHFTVLDPRRHRECLAGRLCALCGLKMGGEVALLGHEISLRPDGYYVEPPVHERCAELAMGGLCPFLHRERVPRRPVLGGDIAVIGDPEDLPRVGRTVEKPPMMMVIARDYYQGAVITPTGRMPVYRARGVLRARRYAWVGGVATEVERVTFTPADPPPERETVRHQHRRAKPRSKRGGGAR
jgi:hypothetical protein